MFLVIHPRFEPGTPWLKVTCSADWANGPYGWGSWIWTNECGNQNPVPYRLAIPQRRYFFVGRATSFELATSRATIWRSTDWATPATCGAPGESRTPDTRLRRPLLYPTELQVHKALKIWSGWWESDPRNQLGRLVFYHWTTPAYRFFWAQRKCR